MSSLTGFTRMKSPVSLLCARRVTKCEQNLQTVFSWALCKELCGKCSLEGTLEVHRSAWKHSRYFEDTLKLLWKCSRFRALSSASTKCTPAKLHCHSQVTGRWMVGALTAQPLFTRCLARLLWHVVTNWANNGPNNPEYLHRLNI